MIIMIIMLSNEEGILTPYILVKYLRINIML